VNPSDTLTLKVIWDFIQQFIVNCPILVMLSATSFLMMLPICLIAIKAIGHSIKMKDELPGRGLYIAAILPPLLWLLAPLLLAGAKGPWRDPWRTLFEVVVYRIEDWFILPFGLFFVVFIVYVFIGCKADQAHQDVFKPRKMVWFVFGAGILFLTWFVPDTLLKAKAKFSGMHIDVMFDTGEAIKDINIAAANLRNEEYREYAKDDLVNQTEALESSLYDLELIRAPSRAANKISAAVAEAVAQDLSKKSAPQISSRLYDAEAAAARTQNAVRRIVFEAFYASLEDITQKAEELQQQIKEKLLLQIATAREKVQALTDTDKADEDAPSKDVEAAKSAIEALKETLGTTTKPAKGSVIHNINILAKMTVEAGLNSGFDKQTRDTIRRTTNQMYALVYDLKKQTRELKFDGDNLKQSWRINEIQDKAHALELAAAALRPDLSPPMLMVALLFVVFLLMPWLLYISFIVRKREQVVNDRLELLCDLNLLERFRTAAKLSRDLTIEGANIARELCMSKNASQHDIAKRLHHLGDRAGSLEEASLAFKKVREIANRQPTDQEKNEIIRLADTETLNRRTFNSREYLIPLIILSALSLVGWYYTIFAEGSNGLVRFVEQGGVSSQLTALLANFTPFTMVFAGAWLVMIIMLTYRWVNNDLYPGSYFYASIRLVWGLLAGMIYLSLFKNEEGAVQLIVALFVGMCPLEFIQAVWAMCKESAHQIVKYFNFPKWASHQPLTALEDITMWDDTRFFQEGILNVHALATADLARLAVRTPYAAQTLVDWVDQAILRIHTKALWHATMTAIGIRGATDFFDCCGVDVDKQVVWNDEMLSRVADEFNAVNLLGLDPKDPLSETYREANALQAAGQTLAGTAHLAQDVRKQLDPAKPGTLDKIIALRSKVSGLKILADKGAAARQKVHKMLIGLGADDVALPWADDGEVDKELKALTEGADSLIAKAENVLGEDSLTSKMLEDDLAKAVDVDKPGQAALRTAQKAVKALVDPAEKVKKAAERSVPQLVEIRKSVQPLHEKVCLLRGKIELILGKAASAKTKGDGLTQDNSKELTEELDKVLAAASEAEAAAGELAAAAASAGDRFSALKDKATTLKEALGANTNQLQAKIKTAKNETAKVASDASALAAAKSTVDTIVAAAGKADSTDSKTIAGQIKAIAEPFQDVEVKLDKVTAAVADLTMAISQANTLALDINIGDATTWDNVKALAGAVINLNSAVQNAEAAVGKMETKLAGLKKQQTVPLLEAQKKVNKIAKDDAKNKAHAAEKAFEDKGKKIVLSAASSETELKEAMKLVESAVAAAETLAAEAASAAEDLMRAVMPSRLTRGALKVMLLAMKNDPNIHYMRRFWKEQDDKNNRADK
jgi:hypothetical protein